MFPAVFTQVSKRFIEIGDKGVGGFRFYNDIIDVSLGVKADLFAEATLNGALICSTNVF